MQSIGFQNIAKQGLLGLSPSVTLNPVFRCQHYRVTHQLSAQVELTSVRYPYVKRGNYAKLEDKDVSFFERLLGKTQVITEASELDKYNTDWLRIVRGSSQILLRPKTTEDVSSILRYCHDRTLAVCPQGGNTGLVGGSVPVFDEIIVSTELMNKIVSLDYLSGAVACQAGCVLEKLDDYLAEKGLMMPLDLGAKGSCHIGGNVSTNAGGLRLLRYGSLHGSVLGVEVVLASGEIMDCMSTLKKDNTGYDLKHLFIGSEGTLGFVTQVAIQCPPRPKAVNIAFLGLESFHDVLKTYSEAKKSLAEILSSCEFMDKSSLDCLQENLKLRLPISDYPFYMLIESSGSHSVHDEEKLNSFLEMVMEKGIVRDGTVVAEPSHIQNIWQIRERISESLLHDGYVYKYDISIPLIRFYDIVTDMRKHLVSDVIRCCGYGHIGDGNLHLNITSKKFDYDILHKIEPYVYEWTAKEKGSVSAEHGLGFKKKDFIYYSKSQSAVRLMKELKKLMDPKGILNPYKVLPD